MKTPYEILYKRNQRHISLMQMKTPFVCEQAAIEAMEIYGRQCFEAARFQKISRDLTTTSEEPYDCFINKFENYEQYKNELK